MASVTLSRINENSIHTHTKSDIRDFPTTMTPTAHNHLKENILDFAHEHYILHAFAGITEAILEDPNYKALYATAQGGSIVDLPDYEWTHILNLPHIHMNGYGAQLVFPFDGNKRIAWRQASGMNWGTYRYIYDTFNPPNVDDITGVLPISKGGTGSDTGKSPLTFLNYGLNPSINIDTIFDHNFVLGRSTYGENVGTFPTTGWCNLINFFSGHFVTQLAFPINPGGGGDEYITIFTRSRWIDPNVTWSKWYNNRYASNGTDYTTSRTRNISLSTTTPTTVNNGAVVLVYS